MYKLHFFAEILGSKLWLWLFYKTIAFRRSKVAGVQTSLPFVYYCVVTKQMFVVEVRLIFVQTSTSSLPLWASAVKTTVVSCKNYGN